MKASVRPHPCPICMRLTTNKGMCDECYNRRKASGYIEAWSRNQQTTKIHQLYYTGRWKKIRSQVLSRDNYLCRECLKQGRATTATEVDHIVPTAKGGRMFDMDNLQSLCHDCHLAKTKAEKG